MRESIMEDQGEIMMRRSGGEEVGSEANNRAARGHRMYIYNTIF